MVHLSLVLTLHEIKVSDKKDDQIFPLRKIFSLHDLFVFPFISVKVSMKPLIF